MNILAALSSRDQLITRRQPGSNIIVYSNSVRDHTRLMMKPCCRSEIAQGQIGQGPSSSVTSREPHQHGVVRTRTLRCTLKAAKSAHTDRPIGPDELYTYEASTPYLCSSFGARWVDRSTVGSTEIDRRQGRNRNRNSRARLN